jgi:hypothetical protein
MKIILIALVIFFPLFLLWRLILKRLTDKAEFQKAENKILGSLATGEIEELEFLVKYFKVPFLLHSNWRREIKDGILVKRFDELKKEYNIENIIDTKK